VDDKCVRSATVHTRAWAGGGECGVVGERQRGDVEERDGGEEEEQERHCRRRSGATRARTWVVRASAGPSPAGGEHLWEGGRGHRGNGGGEVVADTAAAAA
jgi:hypothetical protein